MQRKKGKRKKPDRFSDGRAKGKPNAFKRKTRLTPQEYETMQENN